MPSPSRPSRLPYVIPGALGIGSALAAAFAPWSGAWVDTHYARTLYPAWQRVVTPAANAVPFAVFDVLVVGGAAALVAGWTCALRHARRERHWAPVGRAAWRTTVAAACVYLWFVAGWGLNYRREPILGRLDASAAPPSTAAIEALGDEAVHELNALHDVARAEGWPAAGERPAALARGAADAQARLGAVTAAVPGRPKTSLFGPYFRWAGVDGMVDPFALEVLVNPDLLPLERPFVVAHEWAHLAGYADESEASFVGFLACLRAGRAARYSAWLSIYWEVRAQLPRGPREVLEGRLQAGPRADLRAIAARMARGAIPLFRRAGWEIYDQYLRANRVEGGIRSYSLVLRLVVAGRPLWAEP